MDPIIQTFETRETAPEAYRPYLQEVDGKFQLKLVAQQKLNEFRDTNTNLVKERDTLKAFHDTYKGLVGDDVDAFKAAQEELADLRQKKANGELKGSKEIEEALAKRVETMKADLEAKAKALETRATTAENNFNDLQSRYDRREVEIQVREAASNADLGVLPSAIPDIVRNANDLFQMKDGKLVAMRDGAPVYGADGATPISPAEWIKTEVTKNSPHYFKPSSGGGAGGQGGNGGGGSGRVDYDAASGMDMESYKKARESGNLK